jgi:hypothetical protein
MSTSPIEPRTAIAEAVRVSANSLTVDLADGRTIAVPLAWYPRLAAATVAERNTWRLIGRGEGIHWPDLDEDISVDNLLRGAQSGENEGSFNRWLQSRRPAS